MPYNTLISNQLMTDEQILQLAENYFDYQGGWIAYSKEDLLKFARKLYDKGESEGYYEGYEQCSFDMGDENV